VYDKPEIFVPTAFTPNNDGLNDRLGPYCVGIKKILYFSIYNRWGQLVYSSKQIDGAWDGSYKGASQNSESFVWIVQGESYDGRVVSKKGITTLIR
jgi:gliding motility-associated-like protein